MNIVIQKSQVPRGEEAGGSYLRRIVTGKDADGSPQYRYIRSQEELDAYEANQSKHKSKKKKNKKDDNDLQEKVEKEHKKSSLLIRDKHKDKDESSKKKSIKKSFYIKVTK